VYLEYDHVQCDDQEALISVKEVYLYESAGCRFIQISKDWYLTLVW